MQNPHYVPLMATQPINSKHGQHTLSIYHVKLIKITLVLMLHRDCNLILVATIFTPRLFQPTANVLKALC